MKLPLWYKAANGRWVALTHFPDGKVGLTMEEAIKQELCLGFGRGMGLLDKDFFFDGTKRFLIVDASSPGVKEFIGYLKKKRLTP